MFEDSATAVTAPMTGRSLILGALRARWKRIAAGSMFMVGHQTGESLVPVAIGFFIDSAVASGDSAKLLPGVIALIVVFAGLSNSWRFGAGLLQRAAKGVEHDLRVAVVRRALEPPRPGERVRLSGELLNIATIDAERVGRTANVIATACGAFAALAVTTIVLLRISLPLGLLVLVGSVPLVALIQFLGKTLEKHSGVEQAGSARAAGMANDLVSGLRVLKGIGAEDAAVQRYRGASRESLRATTRAAKTQATYQGLNMALTGVFLAIVALVGGRLAADGKISIGDLIAALGLTQFLIGPMYRLTNVGAMLARARASAERIAAVLSPHVTPPPAGRLPAGIEGRIAFENVRLGTLSDVSFMVEPGQIAGLAVADPADALALVDCLSGAAEPESGRILLDGVPLAGVERQALHTAILTVPHDSYLFGESVLDNIRGGSAADDLQWAVDASATDEVLLNLQQGIDTVVRQGGRSLSGGQRQRVALARALAAGAPVLVLHDPTTAVDSVTEARIAAGVRAARAGRTTLLITTSPALLAITDSVVFIDAGRVVSHGGHAEMLEMRPRYQELVVS